MNYVICETKSREELEEVVNELLKRGYDCLSGVTVLMFQYPPNKDGYIEIEEKWIQTMFKKADK